MKWIMRVGTFFTVFNSFLTGMEMLYPSNTLLIFLSLRSLEHVFFQHLRRDGIPILGLFPAPVQEDHPLNRPQQRFGDSWCKILQCLLEATHYNLPHLRVSRSLSFTLWICEDRLDFNRQNLDKNKQKLIQECQGIRRDPRQHPSRQAHYQPERSDQSKKKPILIYNYNQLWVNRERINKTFSCSNPTFTWRIYCWGLRIYLAWFCSCPSSFFACGSWAGSPQTC